MTYDEEETAYEEFNAGTMMHYLKRGEQYFIPAENVMILSEQCECYRNAVKSRQALINHMKRREFRYAEVERKYLEELQTMRLEIEQVKKRVSRKLSKYEIVAKSKNLRKARIERRGKNPKDKVVIKKEDK